MDSSKWSAFSRRGGGIFIGVWSGLGRCSRGGEVVDWKSALDAKTQTAE